MGTSNYPSHQDLPDEPFVPSPFPKSTGLRGDCSAFSLSPFDRCRDQ